MSFVESNDYLHAIIESRVKGIFDHICEFHNISKFCVKKLLKFEDGSLQKGELSLLLQHSTGFDIADVAQKLKLDLLGIVDDCVKLDNSRLRIVLNRSKSYSYCINQVIKLESKYGSNRRDLAKNILLCVHGANSNGLLNFRTVSIAQHILSVLLFNNHKVYCNEIVPISSDYSTFIKYNVNELDLTNVYSSFEAKISKLKWLMTEDKVSQYIKVNCLKSAIVLDGRRYILESDNSDTVYDKNIGYVTLKDDNFTLCFKDSAVIDYVLEHQAVDVVLHIVPLKKRFAVQQCGLIIDMLYATKLKNHYIVHQQILVKGRQDATHNDLMSAKYQEMEQALIHKYDSKIMMDPTWTYVVDTLAKTAITFDFLLTSFTTPLKIDLWDCKRGLQDKGGAFVQYNCARLATLFKNFDYCVQSGKYDPLPNVENIDFTLLELPEEWRLFFNYVIQFPKLISDLANSKDLLICSHKICQMLVNLSRDLSIYYNKVKVLVEPFPALIPQMQARLYLLQAIHLVMINSLKLLNLTAVEKM